MSQSATSTRMPASPADIELFESIERDLYTAVICDALDDLGIRHQAMHERLRPLFPTPSFAGWVRTISCVDISHVPAEPYAKEIEAVDSILPGEVVVVSTSYSGQNAPWGELLSTAARARGARGAVVDGLVRDVKKIEEIGFPVYATGIKPVDSRGRGLVLDYNVPVECGTVIAHPGDLLFADFDGVVVIPSAVVPEVISMAKDKIARENDSRKELANGAYLKDVYKKYGVL
jgi:4-hydroxy-4-methyl-2-oxoglutarate aldolase